MKKAITIIALCLTFILIYFLQINFFSWFTIAGVMPNLFVLFVLFIGLYLGNKIGTAFGVVIGVVIDFLSSQVIRNIWCCSWHCRIFAEDTLKRIFQKIAKLQL